MTYVPPILIGASTTAASVLAQIDGKTTISLGEAITVFIFVGGLVAFLSRKLQKIEDDVVHLQTQVTEMKKKLDEN